MKKLSTWGLRIAIAITALYFVGASGATGSLDDSQSHHSELRAKITLSDGTVRAVTLQGVGCSMSMCSRVRARDTRADTLWLDGLASVSQISQESGAGPIKALFRFRDGTERPDSVIAANRVLYLRTWFGLSEKLDLASVREISFI